VGLERSCSARDLLRHVNLATQLALFGEDKLDAMWLARLTQWGMLRPSFVPPAAIRRVRDFTRARTDLVHERTRVLQRLEKLLEDAMVKITSVVSDGLKAKSAVAMVQALAAGERDPRKIADLAKGPLRAKRDALAEALDGMFDSHHGVIAQALLDQVAFLDQRITAMEAGAIAALAQVEQSWGVDADGETGPGRGTGPDSRVLAAACRLAEIPGISVWLAIVIIAEIGLNMALFPAPAHLVSWMGLCRSAAQSGIRRGKGKPKKGNSYAPRRRRAGRHRRGRHRHLPGRAVCPHRAPPRRGHRPGGGRPFHHDHRLASARRPRRPLPRPRPGLARRPCQPGQEDP
jgi:transposase